MSLSWLRLFSYVICGHVILIFLMGIQWQSNTPSPKNEKTFRVQTVSLKKTKSLAPETNITPLPLLETSPQNESLSVIDKPPEKVTPELDLKPVEESPPPENAKSVEESKPLEDAKSVEELNPLEPVQESPIEPPSPIEHKPKKKKSEAEKKPLKNAPKEKKMDKTPKPEKRADKTSSSEKKQPVKVDRKETERQEKLIREAEESISKIGRRTGKDQQKSLSLPKSIQSLKVDSETFSSDSIEVSHPVSSKNSYYQDELMLHLKAMLTLPEFGEVKVRLTVKRDGQISSLKVTRSASEKNRKYVEKNLKDIHLPEFGKAFENETEHTFTITLKNEI